MDVNGIMMNHEQNKSVPNSSFSISQVKSLVAMTVLRLTAASLCAGLDIAHLALNRVIEAACAYFFCYVATCCDQCQGMAGF